MFERSELVVHRPILVREREILVGAGQAASFDTMTPHSMASHGGPAELLAILDHHGERAHLHKG